MALPTLADKIDAVEDKLEKENIISEIPGTFIFESIIFSNPLPIDEIKKTPGVIPKSVEKK